MIFLCRHFCVTTRKCLSTHLICVLVAVAMIQFAAASGARAQSLLNRCADPAACASPIPQGDRARLEAQQAAEQVAERKRAEQRRRATLDAEANTRQRAAGTSGSQGVPGRTVVSRPATPSTVGPGQNAQTELDRAAADLGRALAQRPRQ